MLAQDTTFCFGLPGNKTTIEVSLENLRSVLGQIEAELYRSEVYRRAIDTSQQTAAEGTASAQFLMKAIGREAIRLTLRHFVRQSKVASDTQGIQEAEQELDEFPVAAFSRALGAHSSNVTEFPTQAIVKAIQPRSETVASTIANRVTSITKRAAVKVASQKGRKKVSTADLAEQATQERDEQLQKLGEQIKRARLARSMSLSQLHNKTLVPVHQIQALEAGHGAHLPEDIYLRGFIQRICKALEIDSSSLLASLSKPDPDKAILPTWYHPPTKEIGIRGLAVQPVHLYVGYAALMAGGLFWLSRQSAPPTPPGAIDLNSSQITPSSKTQSQQSDAKTSIAPPEMLHDSQPSR